MTATEASRTAHVHPDACYDRSRRNLTSIQEAWDQHTALDEGDIIFLIRMAEQRLYDYTLMTHGSLDPLPDNVTARVVYVALDGSEHPSSRDAAEKNSDIARAEAANALLESGATVWEAAQIWSRFDNPRTPEILRRINKDTPLIISHWQCRDNPGYKVSRFEIDGYYCYVGGDAGSWSGAYGSRVTLVDLARYAEDTLNKHPELDRVQPSHQPQPTGTRPTGSTSAPHPVGTNR